mgnify:CR=1 FL=1
MCGIVGVISKSPVNQPPPNTWGKNISTASMEATDVNQITAPQAAASQRPTAATRSMTAKNTVAVCHAIEWLSNGCVSPKPIPHTCAQ